MTRPDDLGYSLTGLRPYKTCPNDLQQKGMRGVMIILKTFYTLC
jgi:hypothetical protein